MGGVRLSVLVSAVLAVTLGPSAVGVAEDGPPAAGAKAPEVTLHFAGNRTFLWPGVPVEYLVIASDPGKGDTLAGTIPETAVAVAFEKADGPRFDPPAVDTGIIRDIAIGKAKIARSNCVLCHVESGDRPIPSYATIAEVNEDDADALPRLSRKVVTGGSGVWGKTVMPPHPDLSPADAEAMVRYILALARPEGKRAWLPIRGTVEASGDGRHVLWASYGEPGSGARAANVFRPPVLSVAERDDAKAIRDLSLPKIGKAVAAQRSGAYLRFNRIDLTGVRRLVFRVANDRAVWAGGSIETRLDSPFGPSLGTARIVTDGDAGTAKGVPLDIAPLHGPRDLFIVLRGYAGSREGAVALAAIAFGN